MKEVSYSSYGTYSTCPHKFKLEKIDKIMPESQPSHFVFGSALDKAANVLLIGGTKEEALKEASTELLRLFKEKIKILSKDYDDEIMTDLTRAALLKKLRKNGWKGNDVGQLAASLFSFIEVGDKLSKNQEQAIKYLVYFSFLEKISLMIDAYIDYVLPRIKKVVSVQKFVKRGIMDFEAEFKGIQGVVTSDNKTSSQDYPEDAVLNSVQLAGYEGKIGAYIVFNKTVRKNRTKLCVKCGKNGTGQRHATCDAEVKGERCKGEWVVTVTPEVIPQILVNEIPEHNRAMVEQAYSDTDKLIATGVFPRNLNNCGKQYGAPCPYIGLCWKNDMTGLVVVKDKK